MQAITFKFLYLAVAVYAVPAPQAVQTTVPATATSGFVYPTATSTIRYATSLSVGSTTTYAASSTALSHLIPNATYTTYLPISQKANDTEVQYGNAALQAQWVNYTALQQLPFTTTQSPTPVATSELVFPSSAFTVYPPAETPKYSWPAEFMCGVDSSAYQIEGAIQAEGRGVSGMDYYSHIAANITGADITALGYYAYKTDIARLAAIGVPYYSFSISWSRILPFGLPGTPINQQGIDHYDDVINTCIKYGVKPIVTMQHFDMPIAFIPNPTEKLAYAYFPGWDSPLAVDAFANYARILFTHYADRVGTWITINEPNDSAGGWQGVKNVLVAHGTVAKIYREEFKGEGKIALKNSIKFGIPLSGNASDIEATNRFNDWQLGLFSSAIFQNVSYPQSMVDTVGADLPAMSPEELALIYGSSDFNSVNIYYASYISAPTNGITSCASNKTDPHWPSCAVQSQVGKDGWLDGQPGGGGGYMTPGFFRTALQYVASTYPSPGGIFIGEIGLSQGGDATAAKDVARYDGLRSAYYQAYADEMYKAITEDGIKIIGAMAWSIVDLWEFGSPPYGLQWIDRTSPVLQRYYKMSMFAWVDIFTK